MTGSSGARDDNDSRHDNVSRGDNLGYFAQAAAQRHAGRVALIDLHGGRERRFTYAGMEARFARAAGLVHALGLGTGDRVALILGNRSEFIEAFFGAMRVGVIPVPINTRLAPDALDYIVRDCGARAALVDPAVHADAVAVVERAGLPIRVAVDAAPPGWQDYEALMATAPGAPPCPPVAPDQQAFQPYTAGSTGRPKGVQLTHAGMLWSIRLTQRHWPIDPDERALVAVPLFHKNAMRGVIKPYFFAGAQVVLMPGFEPRAFLEALARYRITYTSGVPAVFARLLAHRDLLGSLDFSALRAFMIGSAVVPVELIAQLEEAFPGVAVKEAYGLTEGGGPMRAPLDGRPVPRGSCGVAAPEHDLRLVDANGQDSESFGELWIRCPYIPTGYHNLPELTRERLVDGYLRTGDLFSRDAEGFYYFRGRIDDMFSCGGENIYPKEVENLLFAHPAVLDAVVVPLPHAEKGFAPAAMVILKADAQATPDELKRHCLARGPAYAHPREVVVVDTLPLSGAGKVDRQAVRRTMEERFGTLGAGR